MAAHTPAVPEERNHMRKSLIGILIVGFVLIIGFVVLERKAASGPPQTKTISIEIKNVLHR
jgi:hypothetical protein